MKRIYVICEGSTEEQFVGQVWGRAWSESGIYLYPSRIGKVGHKGGRVTLERIVADARRWLLHDRHAYCTMLVDFYGVHASFPRLEDAAEKPDLKEKSQVLEAEIMEKLHQEIGENPSRRFIPYFQMHEFEGLLFSDPTAMAQGLARPDLEDQFRVIRESFATPEHINNDPHTAPSKRIEKLLPRYQKPTDGTLAARQVGLAAMQRECPLFGAWLERLRALPGDAD